MKRKKLKGFVVPVFSALLFSALLITILSIGKVTSDNIESDYEYAYVDDSIINNTKPVMSEEDVLIRPYQSEEVKVYKKFYDGENDKEDSIIYYNNTYMQNSGVIYNSDKEFDVISILEGEVISVKKDELLGYTVEIKHSNNLISSYEGLKSVNVKEHETISQGDLVGISGEITLDVNLKNALLFELIKDGKNVNPENYYDKKVKEM